MIELRGKYNDCKIFTDNVDNVTIGQIIELLNQESMKESVIRIMPDTHAGKGCVIGTTMTLKDKVIPNLVGVDIGCGMLAVKMNTKEIDFEVLDKGIREQIPAGFNVRDKGYKWEALDKIKAPFNRDRAEKSVGTLGGGNHFIEVDRDTDGYLWLVVHTGSRHLGVEVCKHYQELAYNKLQTNRGAEILRIIEEAKREGKANKIEERLKKVREKALPPYDLAFVEGADFEDYLSDMGVVQEYAAFNRRVIVNKIGQLLGVEFIETIETIHNYIDLQNMILRKGSVSAEFDEKLIIPMNMRDGSLICRGKGNIDWNYSAPHGAGRIMSRGEAKEKVNIEEYKEAMAGIYTTSVCASTIDESPMVYKPMEEIMRNVADTVNIIEVIKPVYNFKAN